MYSTEFPKEVVDAVYARAGRLELQWVGAGLSVDFPDRMIDAVFRFIERKTLSGLSPRQAEGLLYSFWTLNARRDAVRAQSKPEVVSLGDCEYADVQCDPLESWATSGLIEGCRILLADHGVRAEVVEAFLQDALGQESDEIVASLTTRFGSSPSQDTLRQWRHRYYSRASDILRANTAALGLSHLDCHVSGGAPALLERWNDRIEGFAVEKAERRDRIEVER